MFDSLRLRLLPMLGLLLAGCWLMSPRPAHAQFPQGENKWAEIDVTNAINRAIDESNPGAELREKLVRRFSECSLMYGGLSTWRPMPKLKRNTFKPDSPVEINRRLPSHCNRKRYGD